MRESGWYIVERLCEIQVAEYDKDEDMWYVTGCAE
jgi:hypothetical protein